MSLHTHSPKRQSSAIFSLTALLDLRADSSDADSAEMIVQQAAQILQARLRTSVAVAVMYNNGVQQIPLGNKLLQHVPELSLHAVEMLEEPSTNHTLYNHGVRTLVPLLHNDECRGYIGLGNPALDVEMPADIESYLLLAGTIIGTAVNNAFMVQQQQRVQKDLEHRTLMVSTLLEAANDFTGALSVAQILKTLQFHLSGRFMVSRFGIVLAEPLNGVSVIGSPAMQAVLETIAPYLHDISEPVVVDGIDNTNPLRELLLTAGISMVTPTEVHGVKTGVLVLGNRLHSVPFTEHDVSFLEALANTAMAAIENDRLYMQEREQEQLLQQLEIAAEIQRGMLPVELPCIQNLDVAATMIPSQHVGGDYYDVIVLDEYRTLITIADVTGKGMPAALLMANVQAAINVLAHMNIALDELVLRINTLLCENTEPETFVTLFVAIVDTRSFTLHYVNAGHNPPILYNPEFGSVSTLTVGGPLTGVIPEGITYSVGKCAVGKGAVVCLYTDGVSEARNANGLEFDDSRLADTLRAICTTSESLTAAHILNSLLVVVAAFRGEVAAHDDSSLVLIRFV